MLLPNVTGHSGKHAQTQYKTNQQKPLGQVISIDTRASLLKQPLYEGEFPFEGSSMGL